ncbi:MAG: sialate O-acetylesterase, partial [Saprospiraceae bacterium]
MKKCYSLGFFLFIGLFPLLAQIIKPVFHLDASSGINQTNGLIMEWIDPITNIKASQDLVANQPSFINSSIGGKPSIRFNGSSSFMNMASVFPVNKDYTLVVVCKANGPSNNIVGGTSRTLWMAGATSPKILHNADFNNQVNSSIDPGYDPAIIIAQYNNSTQKGRFYINGSFADSSYCPTNLDSTIYLCAYGGLYYFNGDISEIYLYNYFLNQNDRIKLEDALKAKYKIIQPPKPDSTFTTIPSNYQFYPRDNNNEAVVNISGNLFQKGFDSIKYKLFRNNVIVGTTSNYLNYNPNKSASFSYQGKIKAELANYSVEVYVKNKSKDSLIARSTNLVCGDVFIITGQSNSIFGGNTYTNEFCRTFGKNYSSNKNDTLWTIASAVGNGGGPDICAWGMELSRLLIENYKLPICILNGGVGGTTIQQHQRDDINPSAPVNIYGSLLFRALKSNLALAAKAIFWYQGESNGSNMYFENFKSLYQDWKLDYPNVQKTYVVQIHHGCGSGDHAALREILRKLPETFSDIEVLSTNGLSGHDGCHYTQAGYLTLAKNIFPIVQKDFYNAMDQDDIHAPDVKQAYYSKKDFSEIALVFGPKITHLILPKDTLLNGINVRLKDYFAFDNQWKSVKNLRVNKDSLFIELITPKQFKLIQYLPEVNYLDFNAVYEGPYLLNNNNIGGLSFANVPIKTEIPTAIDFDKDIKTEEFYIYPNPSKMQDKMFLSLGENNLSEDILLNIYNNLGEKVFSKEISILTQSLNKIEINFNKNIPGMYY